MALLPTRLSGSMLPTRLSGSMLPTRLSGSMLRLASIALAACGPDAPPPDAPTPRDAPACEDLGPIPRGEASPHSDPLGAGATEARAGVLSAAELPADSTGLGLWRAGDFVLANDRIAVVIEDASASDLFDPWGGKPIAIGRVQGGAIVSAGDFEEMIPALGLHTLHTEHVGVMNDGSDGEPAVIRAVGTIEAIPFLAAFVPGGLAIGVEGMPAALEWSLAPGADHVEVRWVLDNTSTRGRRIENPIHAFLQASRMPPWAPGVGFDVGAASAYPYVAFLDEDRTSYAYEAVGGPLDRVLEAGGANFFVSAAFAVRACAREVVPYGRLFIGDRDGLGGALRVRAEAAGETLGDVVVRTVPATPGIEISATTAAGEHRGRATSASDGTATLALAPGETISLTPVLGGVVVGAAQTIPAGATSFDLVLDPLVEVNVSATDALDGAPIPARLQAIAEVPPTRPPPSFGARIERGERAAIAFEIDGSTTFLLPLGRYRVVASRGYEWEMDDASIDVVAGPPIDVDLALSHVVDTTGVLCGDFHIHTNRSPDAPDGADLKVRSAIADGLEIPVRSDHEFVSDFEETITALGAESYAFGVASLELTTYAWGHFGVFPLEPEPSRPNGGAFEWAYRDPPEVLEEVRARTGPDGPPAIIINHPRDDGSAGPVAFAYFNAAGYDPLTGAAERPEMWDTGWSLIEVFNDSNFDRNEGETVRDWFSFLSRGERTFAVGSSDTHEIVGSPVGYPRTCLELGTDSTATLRTMGSGAVRDALTGGHATISGGIYLTALAGTAGPGDDATGVGPRASIDVTVQAASWIDADHLRVFVDGTMTEDIPFTSTDAVLRFDDVVEVDVAASGSWVVFVASGDEPMEPVHPGRMPFAVTNPIFLAR